MALPGDISPQNIMGSYGYYQAVGVTLNQFFDNPAQPNGLPSLFKGNRFSYDVYRLGRAVPPFVPYGSPALARQMPYRETVHCEALSLAGKINFDPDWLNNVRELGGILAGDQAGEYARALQTLKNENERAIEFARAQWLTGGMLLGANGQTPNGSWGDGTIYLPSAGMGPGSPQSISSGIPTTHLLNAVPGTTAWNAVDSTTGWGTADIMTDLAALRALIVQDAGIDIMPTILMNSVTYRETIGRNLYGLRFGLAAADSVRMVPMGEAENIYGFKFVLCDTVYQTDNEFTVNTAHPSPTPIQNICKYIPDKVAVILPGPIANAECGRDTVLCQPSDTEAGPDVRGFFAFEDTEPAHPHRQCVGYEWNGMPRIQNPDSIVVISDVTAHS